MCVVYAECCKTSVESWKEINELQVWGNDRENGVNEKTNNE